MLNVCCALVWLAAADILHNAHVSKPDFIAAGRVLKERDLESSLDSSSRVVFVVIVT
jgi:hypothetical protein